MDELQDFLSTRYGDEVNSFEIEPASRETPHLTVIIRGTLATLHFIASFDRPGFVPDNPNNGLEDGGFTVFYYGLPNSEHLTYNRQIVTVEQALGAAKEFATKFQLPKSILWLEL